MKKNNVYNMDIIDFLKKIKNNSVDLIIADPPYNQRIDYWDEFENEPEYMNFMKHWLKLAIKKLSDNGSIYIFNNSYNSALLLPYLLKKQLILQNWIIWYKKDGFNNTTKRYVNNQETILFLTKSKNYTFNYNDIRCEYTSKDRLNSAANKGIIKNGKRWFPNPNGKLCTDVWEISSVRLSNKIKGKTIKTDHPTPKPAKLIERIIKASSNEGDLVLDLFSGSGITSLECIRNNRNFLSCEKDEKYYRLIKEKIDAFN
ncbi:site-specific DNA-methyltransferase [Mycoplasma feriruminatoris]|uniref:DNA-methyltransferase n=1 Tax=Mycoplasma feriruminatoris TaxID=1179777 RepID=UPI00241D982B|nr:site-specific DNA-methyltransferase [Mycoplasma feriruminatoris]WFQ90865.1 site-specific DNA-methyltransferase [Mycoplasma feriruminatoris]